MGIHSRIYRGRTLLESGDPAAAEVVLAGLLSRDPANGRAQALRGRALVVLGRTAEAIAAFTHAIDAHESASPSLYLQRADAQARLSGSLGAQLAGIEEGLARLGPVAVLGLRACDLHERSGQIDAALARLDVVGRQSRRQAPWLARRGEILIRARRFAEARLALTEARAELAEAPASRRQLPAGTELTERIETLLADLDAAPDLPL